MLFAIETLTPDEHRALMRDTHALGEKPPPVGVVVCRDCGGDFLYARIEDGRRFPFEPSDEGEWDIVKEIAKPKAGGEFAIHNCRRTA